MPGSGNDKTGVKPVSWKYRDYIAGVPIKKMRFPMTRPPSPPPEEEPSLPPAKTESVQQEQSSQPEASAISHASIATSSQISEVSKVPESDDMRGSSDAPSVNMVKANWDLYTLIDAWEDSFNETTVSVDQINAKGGAHGLSSIGMIKGGVSSESQIIAENNKRTHLSMLSKLGNQQCKSNHSLLLHLSSNSLLNFSQRPSSSTGSNLPSRDLANLPRVAGSTSNLNCGDHRIVKAEPFNGNVKQEPNSMVPLNIRTVKLGVVERPIVGAAKSSNENTQKSVDPPKYIKSEPGIELNQDNDKEVDSPSSRLKLMNVEPLDSHGSGGTSDDGKLNISTGTADVSYGTDYESDANHIKKSALQAKQEAKDDCEDSEISNSLLGAAVQNEFMCEARPVENANFKNEQSVCAGSVDIVHHTSNHVEAKDIKIENLAGTSKVSCDVDTNSKSDTGRDTEVCLQERVTSSVGLKGSISTMTTEPFNDEYEMKDSHMCQDMELSSEQVMIGSQETAVATALVTELEYSNSSMASDDAAFSGRGGRKFSNDGPINHRIPSRRRSPIGEQIVHVPCGNQRNFSPGRCDNEDTSGLVGTRHHEKFVRSFPDDSVDPMFNRAQNFYDGNSQFGRGRGRWRGRGNRDYSFVERRGFQDRSKSPIRTRTRSPGTWSSPRGRSSDGFGGPGEHGPRYRMQKFRSPDETSFTGEMVVRRDLPNDLRDMDSGRGRGNQRWSVQRSPSHVLHRNRRFDVTNPRERAENNEFFAGGGGPVHSGRMHELGGDGNGDERRRFGERRGPVRTFRPPYNNSAAEEAFQDNTEDGPRPFRFYKDGETEFQERGNLRERDTDRGITNRPPGNAPKRMRSIEDQEGNFRNDGQPWNSGGFDDISQAKKKVLIFLS